MSATTPALRRVRGLARTNTITIMRNRLTLVYAVLVPLLPLALLFTTERGNAMAGIATVSTVLLMALMFPIYYNVLSMVVTRRDELVLKRLRTGEATDAEILVSMVLPGAVITLLVTVLTIPLAMAAGHDFPVNVVLVLLGVLLACVAFAGLAMWTAAWTRTAEAAQMTSMPVIVLAVVGLLKPVFPEATHVWLSLTPGAALNDLVRVAWFGRTRDVVDPEVVGFAGTWLEVAPALGVLLAWIMIALALATRSMRWEPRT